MCEAITNNNFRCNCTPRYGNYCGRHKAQYYEKLYLKEKKCGKEKKLKIIEKDLSEIKDLLKKGGNKVLQQLGELRKEVRVLTFSTLLYQNRGELNSAPLSEAEILKIARYLDSLPERLTLEEGREVMREVPILGDNTQRDLILNCLEGKLLFRLIWEFILEKIENRRDIFKLEMANIMRLHYGEKPLLISN